MKNKLMFFLFTILFSSTYGQRIVNGIVTDDSKMPLSGVNIIIKGSAKGTTTDFDGKYSISVNEKDILIFSYLGYKSKEISTMNKTKIDVILVEDTSVLNKVVLIGYGSKKKSDLTGSIAVVSMKEMNKQTISTVDQALQGNIAGVEVVSNSGTPGGGVSINIRGIGTINSADPLFVVDGMMVGDIDYLSPDDIASIQVLKDASASAIYGAKGANGVIIISTKFGKKSGNTNISFSSKMGYQNFWRTTNVLDAPSWAKLRNEALVAVGQSTAIPNPEGLATTNWFEEISHQNAPITDNKFSVSGGVNKLTYYISTAYLNQDGIINKTHFDRLSFRLNTTYKAKKYLEIGENLTISKLQYKTLGEQDEWTSTIITSIAADPASPVKNNDGSFARMIYNDTWNPVAIQYYTNDIDKQYRTLGNVYAKISFLKDFLFKSSLSIEYNFGKKRDFFPVYNVSSIQQNSITKLNINNSDSYSLQLSNTLNYRHKFGKHNISALIGNEIIDGAWGYNGISVNNVPENTEIQHIDNSPDVHNATVWGSRAQGRQLSYLSRINYDYMDKYLLTVNFRADATSKFSKKHRWAYFPSFSLGWKIYKEKFMKNIKPISNLKLRIGWGQIGNESSIPAYQNYTTASSGANYLWGGHLAPGFAFMSSGNDEIKWETSTTINTGIDFGLFSNKLSGTIDYFVKNTSDMLLQVPIPSQSGLQSPPWLNAGSMRNSGIEVALKYTNKEHAVKYSAGIVFTKVKNTVTDLGKNAFISSGSFMNKEIQRTVVGMPIAQFYGYKTDGIFQNQAEINAQTAQTNVAPGDVRYVDADNDGELDFFYLGSPLPDFTYGFNANAGYKNFDLSIQLQGSQGNKIFNGTSYYKRSSTAKWNLGRDMVNRWTGEGSQNDAKYPRMNANDVNNSLISDRYIEYGSYLRIKNLQLGYNFIKKIKGVNKIRLFVNASNLYTLTGYSGLDPEVGRNNYNVLDMGIDRGFYPQARTYSFGIKVDM